jgi:hypothetical protein
MNSISILSLLDIIFFASTQHFIVTYVATCFDVLVFQDFTLVSALLFYT